MIKHPKDDSVCSFIYWFTFWHNVTFQKISVLPFHLYLVCFDKKNVNNSIDLALVIQLVPSNSYGQFFILESSYKPLAT